MIMKFRIFSLCAVACLLSVSSCHYGVDAVKEDVKRNEEYKAKRAERDAATALPPDAAGAPATQEADTASR
jgi:hypothetical protein